MGEDDDDDDGYQDVSGATSSGELPQPEPLSAAVAKQAEVVVEALGEYIARCIYSKHWSLREHAVKSVIGNLQATFEKQASPYLARGMNTLLKRVLKDKVGIRTAEAFTLKNMSLPPFLPLCCWELCRLRKYFKSGQSY